LGKVLDFFGNISYRGQAVGGGETGGHYGGEKSATRRLRDRRRHRPYKPSSTAARLQHSARLPCGNFGCPAATTPRATVEVSVRLERDHQIMISEMRIRVKENLPS
jgi:hypothetical protein